MADAQPAQSTHESHVVAYVRRHLRQGVVGVKGQFAAQPLSERLGLISLDREIVDLETLIFNPADHHHFDIFGVLGAVGVGKSENPRQFLDGPLGLIHIYRCPAVLRGDGLDFLTPQRFARDEL
ncbi:hypothetical protein [Amycolatopsis taiwanensis]|uniref:hypothetical protein n=1 Tax=Amycolatopsis taiwanensis TaxID=342230 RepID=UPI00255347E0|nr:hypothetical protein [Amycolatopsis taiwanensis]